MRGELGKDSAKALNSLKLPGAILHFKSFNCTQRAHGQFVIARYYLEDNLLCFKVSLPLLEDGSEIVKLGEKRKFYGVSVRTDEIFWTL